MSIAYRPEVDGLRAIAILTVVLFHYIGLNGGFVGVDVFFVISGYLITSIIFEQSSENRFQMLDFYKRRIKRIFPALLTVLLCSFIFGWLYLLADEFAGLGLHITAGAGFFSNILLLKESGYFDSASELKPLLHLWSLSIEEQFYLLWPALLVALKKLNIPVRPALITIVIVSFCANIVQMQISKISSFYLPVMRFWELGLGGILYGNHFTSYLNRHTLFNHVLSLTGLILIASGVYFFNSHSNFPGWLALAPTLGAFSLLASSGNSLINKYILNSKPFIFIGLISYPLYLWHWPIISFLRIIEVNGLERAHKIFAALLSLILAWLTFKYIERPLRSSKNNNTGIYLLTAMLTVGCLGYLTYRQKGYDFRYPEIELIAKQLRLTSSAEIAHINKIKCSRFNQSDEDDLGCFISDPEQNPTIMAIGDSHAVHNTIGMINYFQQKGENFSIIFQGGCLPFYQVRIFRTETESCSRLMAGALDYASMEPSIKTVILASRGPWYLTGHEYKQNNAHKFKIGFLGDKELNDPNRIFEQGLRITLDKLTQTGKKVIVLADNPELGFEPKTCIRTRPLTFGTEMINESCAEPLSDVKERTFVYRAIIAKIIKDYPTIKVLDAEKYFCDASYCYGKLNGQIMYSDKNHLSAAGQQYLGEHFIRELGNQ